MTTTADRYKQHQHYAILIGFALVLLNGIVAAVVGGSAYNYIFAGLGLVMILLRGDLAGKTTNRLP